MRVLLDEDVDIHLRNHFPDEVTVETVEYRGWKGPKNGALLHAAQEIFDVLVTMDDNIPYQQSLRHFDLAVVILRPSSKRLEDLLMLIPEFDRIVPELRPGHVTRIYPPK